MREFDNFPVAPSYSGHYLDFTSDEDAVRMIVTAINGGSGAVVDTLRHGVLKLTGAATTDDSGAEAQVDAASVVLATGKTDRFLFRFRLNESTSENVHEQSEMLLGVATLDTSVLASAPTDCILISKADGGALLDLRVRAGGADVATATSLATLARATWYTLAIEVAMDPVTATKGVVRVFLDGTCIQTMTVAGLPTGAMSPVAVFQTGDGTGTKWLDLDVLGVRLER